ncbi:MAG TPA: tyrosine-protein phosphatase [Bryobacteraceae bacterium]|nr:tyrosine-protein phosphatase [Bryobacteraceae bacterium]
MRFLAFLVVSLLAALPGVSSAAAQDLSGLPNFHRVNAGLFRGGQPTREGLAQLRKLGVRTVVDLREAGQRSRTEEKIVESLGMHYVNVPMRGLHAPDPDQIAKVERIFRDSSAGPVFVHCRRGADRTGTVVAIYRIAHDGWDNARALSEARSLGMSRLEWGMQHYVRNYRSERKVEASAPVALPAAAIPAN